MSSSPTVSVLMTAYNREKYIAEAVESVLASTFQDFELIIVDDCSDDRTVEIAKQFTTDSRVQLHINEKNLGDYVNRNCAASFACGKYLKYVDSDDVIYPHGLQVMVDAMEKFPGAALGMTRPASVDKPYPFQLEPEQAYREHFLGGGLFIPGPGGCIIRTDAFCAVSGFSGQRHAGDTELWLCLGARYPVVKIASDLIWWRRHSGQEFQRELRYPVLSNSLRFRIVMQALTSPFCPLSTSDLKRAIYLVKHRHARNIWSLAVRKRRLRSAFELYSKSNLTLGDMVRALGRTNGIR